MDESESGVSSGTVSGRLYPDDPLWDGDGYNSSSNCCSFNILHEATPLLLDLLPYARLCSFDDNSVDSPVVFIELYVK